MPTVMCRLAKHWIKLDQNVSSFRLLHYIGEVLHEDQKFLLSRVFPSAQNGTIQLKSVDGTCFQISSFLFWVKELVFGNSSEFLTCSYVRKDRNTRLKYKRHKLQSKYPAGLIGLPDAPGGVGQSMIMEMITDTGDLITAEGVKGNVVITNATPDACHSLPNC